LQGKTLDNILDQKEVFQGML